MKFFLVLFFALSGQAFADTCLLDSDCPLDFQSPNCYVVKTGIDPLGAPTCRLACYPGGIGGEICRKRPGQELGRCVSKLFSPERPFDPENYDCRRALSQRNLSRVLRPH